VKEQQKAGVRLAHLLNAALASRDIEKVKVNAAGAV
jgi:hypothetical protein